MTMRLTGSSLVGAAAFAAVIAMSAGGGSPPPLVVPPRFSDVSSTQPAWSPDGKRLALVRTYSRREPDVVVMNADRSRARRLGVGYRPEWSLDGTRVVFVERAAGGERRYLTIARADGSGSRRLLRIEGGWDDQLAWSPDGRLIAFRTGIDISVIRPDGKGLRRLVRGAGDPDWSPDGKRIVFTTSGNLTCCHLEVANADGSDRTRLDGPEPGGGESARWSPDGRRIAFVFSNEGNVGARVYVMRADGTDPVPVTPRGFWNPSWTADSARLAVTSSIDGEIYLAGFDGAPPERFTYGGCTIVGSDGPDTLTGRPSDDIICGFGGADLIRGGSGDDRILGGSGDDRILGGRGRDSIFAEDGADNADGGAGRDSLHGGAGADTIGARDGQIDLVDGGPGDDRATADARDCVLNVERSGGVGSCEPQRSFSQVTDPAWSPDGKRIVFVNQVGTVGTLYSINVDGSGLRRVTPPGFDAGWPSWSPDGRRIVFEHTFKIGPYSWKSEIYVIGSAGRGLRRVASGYQPSWGPGGSKIAFARKGRLGNERIHVVSPDGSGTHLVADSRDDCEVYIQPTWSPDGEFVAFAATGAGGECGFQVFIGASRGFGARVKVLAGCWCEQPAWSPDGKQLALVTYPPAGGNPYYRIALFDVQRKTLVRELHAGWHPRWSPDTRRLVFVNGDDPFESNPRSQIYIIDSDGTGVRRLIPRRR